MAIFSIKLPVAVIAAECAPPQAMNIISLPLRASITLGRSQDVLFPWPKNKNNNTSISQKNFQNPEFKK